MANNVIAVRIANGSFVPVLTTESKTRRRLVLTTVNDDQSTSGFGFCSDILKILRCWSEKAGIFEGSFNQQHSWLVAVLR